MRQFLRELKRRRLLHTASLYVVGAWIALQVAEVLSGAGLPPSTIRNLLIILSAGFPVALLFGWFFDVSKEGIRRTGPLGKEEQPPDLKFIDFVLLCGIVIVVLVDAYVLSLPLPSEGEESPASEDWQASIAVLAFGDIGLTDDAEAVGDVIASDLRNSLSRVDGLRVLGPATSKAISQAGSGRLSMAKELDLEAILLGEVLLNDNQLQITTRLVSVPAGDELWTGTIKGAIGEINGFKQEFVHTIAKTVAPRIKSAPDRGAQMETGSCEGVYDLYLRGKQLSQKRRITEARMHNRGVELLQEAVSINDQCALAWEALAMEALVWRDMAHWVKADAAARRALRINEAMPEALSVLAEIAEEEERFSESEELFLRALYADSTNARVNILYAEALMTRGRVQDALHYALEAYLYDPASSYINYLVAMIANTNGDADLAIKHATNAIDLLGERHSYYLDQLAEAHLIKGDTERALEIYNEMGDEITDWYLECVRFRNQPDQYPALAVAVDNTLAQFRSGVYKDDIAFSYAWQAIRCGTWIGVAKPILDLLIEHEFETELRFPAVFIKDAANLRQHPRFHDLVTQYGLDDYWRQWGWSDYCKPDGDSFICN